MVAVEYKVFRFEGFTLDIMRRFLRTDDQPVELRPKSFDVLCCLVERAGQLLTKDEIVKAVWRDVIVGDDSLARCISDVRQALGDGDQRIVKTVPRRGYLLAAPVSRVAPGDEEARRLGQSVSVLPASACDPIPSAPRGGSRDRHGWCWAASSCCWSRSAPLPCSGVSPKGCRCRTAPRSPCCPSSTLATIRNRNISVMALPKTSRRGWPNSPIYSSSRAIRLFPSRTSTRHRHKSGANSASAISSREACAAMPSGSASPPSSSMRRAECSAGPSRSIVTSQSPFGKRFAVFAK